MTPPLDPMEQIAALVPGSRVSVSFDRSNPPDMPWIAWLDHWPNGTAQTFIAGGKTKPEALRALMEQVRKKAVPAKPMQTTMTPERF